MNKLKANPLLGKESERCQEKKRSGGKLDTDQYIDLMVSLTDQYILSQGWQTLIVLINIKICLQVNLIDLSDEDGRRALHAEEGEPETDEERLEKLKKIRDTLRQVRCPIYL